MLTTLLRPTRGAACVVGHDLLRDPLAIRRRIGVVFQDTTLDLDLSAEENLRYVARLYGLRRAQASARVDEALELFGLSERRRELVRTFSGGMRRALDLARGVLHRPDVLFLDEPTRGLDPGQRRRVWQFLIQLAEQLDTTLFLTTHHLEEADPCHRVAIINGGRLVASGSPSELKRAVGRESIDIEVEAGVDADHVAGKVHRLTGLTPQRRPGTLTLSVEDAQPTVARLIPLIRDGISVAIRRPSLEDAFFAVTEPDRRRPQA
jgi:ABC-2 type transport system ATP-binding protein